MDWILKYEGGFCNGEGYEAVEFLLSKNISSDKALIFQAYDANLCPLPNASEWSEEWRTKQVEFLNGAVDESFHGDVWLDDVLVRGART